MYMVKRQAGRKIEYSVMVDDKVKVGSRKSLREYVGAVVLVLPVGVPNVGQSVGIVSFAGTRELLIKAANQVKKNFRKDGREVHLVLSDSSSFWGYTEGGW